MRKNTLLIGILSAGILLNCTNATNDSTHDETSTDTTQVELTTEDEFDPNQTSFGLVKVDIEKAITVDELLKEFEGKTELEATFKGEIAEVCSKMGCWVRIKKGTDDTFQVRFKDHFGIPLETEEGTWAYLTGKAVQDTISVERQQHYLEDANASQEEIDAIKEPKIGMSFIAEGIELIR